MVHPIDVMRGTVEDVVARIERMPVSRWHLKARFIIGIATLFDGFDNLAIAYVLPVLAPQWHLSTPQIGLLLSASLFGQLLAALFFGWWAERIGRKNALICSILIYSLLSLACAFAWDYKSLLVLRTLQGFGIGGEVPVAMTYIAELSRSHGRGRFVLLYELVFPTGLLAAAIVGAWVVPQIGWRWLFVVGAFPVLLVYALSRLPESPRWLATQGRHAEADFGLDGNRAGNRTVNRPSVARAGTRIVESGAFSPALRSLRPTISKPNPNELDNLDRKLLLHLRTIGLASEYL